MHLLYLQVFAVVQLLSGINLEISQMMQITPKSNTHRHLFITKVGYQKVNQSHRAGYQLANSMQINGIYTLQRQEFIRR